MRHHAEAAFTVELTFNEKLARVIAVTNGEVTRARRFGSSKSRSWEITVEPDGTDAVEFALEATTDCASTGTVCTAANRPLFVRGEWPARAHWST